MTPLPARVVLGLFFLSGACTLVYELVWVRMLVLVFGASVLAVSTVLTAFMAGLALGSAWFGRVVDRSGDGLRIYAWLELGIGLFALAFPLLLAGLDDVYTLVYRHLGGNDPAFALIRFLMVFLVLLMPTTLMGATLPVLTRFVTGRLAGVGNSVGKLYAVNTLGAVVGCFVAAFVLIDLAGVRTTIHVTAAVNLLIAVASFLLGARVRAPRSSRPREAPRDAGPVRPVGTRLVSRLVFWGFALSGFTALGYEVLWTRLLSVSMHLTATETLSLILIAFLLGLAAGGAVGARYVDRWRRLFALFGGIEVLLGLFGLGSIAILGTVPYLLRALDVFPSWWGYLLKLLLVALAVVIIPTFLMGVLFPVAGKLHVTGLGNLGRRIGNIYAVNTTGAILGAFVAGFVLIPLLGTQRSIQLLAWINVALGSAVLAFAPGIGPGRRTRALAALIAPVLLVAWSLPPTLTADLMGRSEPGSELLYHDEDTGGTVTVYERKNGKRLLRVNGAGEVPTDHASIQVFCACWATCPSCCTPTRDRPWWLPSGEE